MFILSFIVNTFIKYCFMGGIKMKAVVMACDEGAMLRPLTSTLPVGKLEITGKPILFYVLDNLLDLDVSEIILILKYKSSQIEIMFPEFQYKGIPVTTVIEESFSGTAGCIKNAIGDFNETVLVLNSNAFFEFDLRLAKNRHISNGNDATIICKSVDDPREYGVVNVNENNEIIEFIEKPSWSEAYSDIVNCGIYFLEPAVLKRIPENKVCDLKKDLFPRLLSGNFKFQAFICDDYWCEIETQENFKKVQFDIIGGKTNKKPPFIAENIFTESSIPTGNFVIVPPVYFGKNVQIESGAVIGPYAVIGEGSLVSKGSKIRESILLKNVYVSSGCSVNGAILADGVSVKKGASVFENCVLGEDVIIGEESVVANGVMVWPNKTIENGVTVTENVRYSQPVNTTLQINNIIFGDFGVELTPEKTARLGSAIGTLFDGIRVGIGIDGETNSLALKCGMLGGLISVGAKTFDFGECFFSQIFYYSAFCDTDIAIFISGGENGVSLSLCEKGGVALPRDKTRKIEMILNRGEFNRSSCADCQSVSVMNTLQEMYLNEIIRQFDETKISLSGVLFFCGNDEVSCCVRKVLERLGVSRDKEDFIVKINNTGTKITVIENAQSFSHEKILTVVAHNEMQNGNDIALPWDAPQIITTLGNSLGRKTFRISEVSNHQFENSKTNNVSINQLWSRDAIFLMFRLLKIMNDTNKTLGTLVSELPEFYVAKKVMEIDVSPALISKELLCKDFKTDESGGVTLKNEKGVAKVRSETNGKSLKIITEAVTMELAEELCGDIEKLISIDIDN